jgi:site-specific recombinase XerD
VSSDDVASFLDTREKQKTFEDTIKRLSNNTQNGIQKTNKNFEDFCKEYYEKTTEQVLEELKLFKGDKLDQKTRSVIQNWIDWQYEKGILTSTIKQRVSRIKRLLRFSRVKVHFEDFEEPLEFSAKIKEELYELTLQDIQTIFKLTKPKPSQC